MAFTEPQLRQLKAKLEPKHIKTRTSDGAELSYLEGWHTIAEANRIFGYDGWDRRTIFTSCVFSAMRAGNHQAAYIAKVRIAVRAGDSHVFRDGSGSGEASASTPGQAHERALKTAETDATKRALATFGNPFGLALYDREQAGVKKVRRLETIPGGPWMLRSASGKPAAATYDTEAGFIGALELAMTRTADIECLYDLWEQNIETLRAIHRSSKISDVVPQMVAHLRACAIALVKARSDCGDGSAKVEDGKQRDERQQRIDKSLLTFSEPKRIRDKGHLRFVASQPCVICGRSPSYAHHIRYAQPRGLSLKVSDEFTVPLCAIHHHHIHTTGNERQWWQERKIDPLAVAASLWAKSRANPPGKAEQPTASKAPTATVE
jgi:DNA recombination protein Rad52